MPRAAADTREHVLSVARELFYWHGIRATGVDRIAADAGVSPTTLYRLFASKDDLVAAYVEREQRGYEAWFEAATDVPSGDPRDRILALFEALAEAIDPRRCRGCRPAEDRRSRGQSAARRRAGPSVRPAGPGHGGSGVRPAR